MNTQESFPYTYEGVTLLVDYLRSPNGCPWDRGQTNDSLKEGLIEECYELVEAIETTDASEIVEEIGDVLLQIVLHIQIASQSLSFSQEHVFKELIEKVIRRHPHVFGNKEAESPSSAMANWDDVKLQERSKSHAQSLLDGLPSRMPALAYAQASQKRARATGFDWNDLSEVLDKIVEELQEIEESSDMQNKEEEVGDLLFSVVNAIRWMGFDAEATLRHANRRFYNRFTTMEELSRLRGFSFKHLSESDKNALWDEAKVLNQTN